MSTVTFVPAIEASQIKTPTNVISIGSPGDLYYFACIHKRVLRLEFDDVEGFVGSDGHTVFSHIEANKVHAFVAECKGEPILVHCQAGMSRSAAVAKYLADKRGYQLVLSPPCIGTVDLYNRHVYGTLNLADADCMSRYYAEMELADRLRGEPLERF
ncbi:hypothetical protein [Stutzerimonas nitrititolerans]|uniref:hypothetical protein n=1 Tax=Stutzerimonas nitrititolerans TaxID=2482751 RepID=UPI0028AEDC66|nr:hypothetical protein [Stutzerimonas nitrititolerans]